MDSLVEGEGGDGAGAARTCWIFLDPASWVRIVGHFIARERSMWAREDQDSGVRYSAGP